MLDSTQSPHFSCCHCGAVQNPYPQAERLLYSFGAKEDLKLWTVFSDKEYGGKSTAELVLSESEPVSPLLHSPCSHDVAMSLTILDRAASRCDQQHSSFLRTACSAVVPVP